MRWKNRTLIQLEPKFTKDYCLWWKDFEQKFFKIFIFCLFSKLELYSIYIFFFSRGAALLIRKGYLKQGSTNILKQFLNVLKRTFGKSQINVKSLKKSQPCFLTKICIFWFISRNHWPYFLFHISKMCAITNLSALCSLKALYPKYFYCLLDYQCAKYGISFLQIWNSMGHDWEKFVNHKFYFNI